MGDRIRVAVLMGGRSGEREVSLSTGRMVLGALDPETYDAVPIDCGRPRWLVSLAEPDVAFIALHGQCGEDGTIQGLLELLGIPYTGSGVLGSALAMHKGMAKRIFRAEGIPTPEFLLLEGPGEIERFLARWESGEECFFTARSCPLVVKPNEGGSTIGISIVRAPEEMAPALRLVARHDARALIERYVPGTEITAAVIGNEALEVLPLVEIVPEGGFYDYERKYTPGLTEEIVPARIPPAAAERAGHLALRAHRALQCRGMSRVDMIVTGEEVTVLEVNTIPGMTPTSLLPRAAEAAGIPFPRLLDRLIDLALEAAPGRSRAAGRGSRVGA